MTVNSQLSPVEERSYSLSSKDATLQFTRSIADLEMSRFVHRVDGTFFNLVFNFSDIFQLDNNNNNSTSNQNISLNMLLTEFNSSLYIYNRVPNIILISVYITLFVVAIFSNVLVIVIVYRYQRLRSVTNYLLVNLSCADLMVTIICIPMAIGTNIYRLWIYGDVLCKIVTSMEGVAVSSSVFTLTAMSLERYIAIRHPMTFRKVFNKTLARNVIVVVWMVSFSLFIPVLIVRKTVGFHINESEDTFIYCVEKWPENSNRKLYSALLFVIVYAIPGHVLILAYSMMGCTLCTVRSSSMHLSRGERHGTEKLMKGRRKNARIMLLLALTFALCWLPYNILTLLLENKSEDNILRQKILGILPFTLLLGHANSAINPLLYCLLAKTFRRCVSDAICCCLAQQASSSSSTVQRQFHHNLTAKLECDKTNKMCRFQQPTVRIKEVDSSDYSTSCSSCSGVCCSSSRSSGKRGGTSSKPHSPKLTIVTTNNTETSTLPKCPETNV